MRDTITGSNGVFYIGADARYGDWTHKDPGWAGAWLAAKGTQRRDPKAAPA